MIDPMDKIYVEQMQTRQRLVTEMTRSASKPIDRGLAELELNRLDDELRRRLPDGADLNLRSLLLGGGRGEFRAIGAAARTTITGKGDFGAVFLATLAGAVPLLKVARVVETPTGRDMAYSYVSTHPAAGDVVADGGAAASGEPTFAGGVSKSYKYMRTMVVASEVVTDSFADLEGDIARNIVELIHTDLNDDLYGGDGSAAAQGLLAGPSATTAASASSLVWDDLLNALGSVGAQYWPTSSILCSGGGVIQLRRQTLGTGAAGGQAVPLNAPLTEGFVPIYADAGLATPATGVRTAIIGSFEHGYMVRMTPVEIEVSGGTKFETDQFVIKVKLRADGRRLNTAALRAVVMA